MTVARTARRSLPPIPAMAPLIAKLQEGMTF
jgi:hypothetical protein